MAAVLLDHRGPAAVAGHVDVDSLRAVDIFFDLVVVHGLVAGVEAVLEGGHPVPAGGEEVEPDAEVTFGAVRDAADEPLGTLAPTTWDETRALEAKAGEYVIVAKRGRQDAEDGFFHRFSKIKSGPGWDPLI